MTFCVRSEPFSFAREKSMLNFKGAQVHLCLLLGMFFVACASPVRSAKSERTARNMIPVPICISVLPRGGDAQHIVVLTQEENLLAVFPALGSGISTRPNCAGRFLFEKISVEFVEKNLDSVVAAGADGMKIVWLNHHRSESGARLGTLALTRQVENLLEIYALGLHTAGSIAPSFSLERIGPELAITATNETCTSDRKRCRASTQVYLMSSGRLIMAAEFPVAGVAKGTISEEPMPLTFRFSASASFNTTGIHVTEHISVTDPTQGEVRASDLEREFVLENGSLSASTPSAWSELLLRMK